MAERLKHHFYVDMITGSWLNSCTHRVVAFLDKVLCIYYLCLVLRTRSKSSWEEGIVGNNK